MGSTIINASRSAIVPRIDGKLDEPFWNAATPFSDFKMVDPTSGIASTENTELRVVCNQNGTYTGIRCFSSEPGTVIAHTVEHDRTEGI